MSLSAALDDPAAGPLNWRDKRARRERLGQIGNTPGIDRGRAVRRAVIAGNVNDGSRHTFVRKPLSHRNAGLIFQIDVDDDAGDVFEITVVEECLRRGEQQRAKAVFSEQPLDAHAHR